MPNILLAISALLIFIGVFFAFGTLIDRDRAMTKRFGRLVISFAVEAIGLVLFAVAWNLGAKVNFAIPVLIASMAFGTILSSLHHMLFLRARSGEFDRREE